MENYASQSRSEMRARVWGRQKNEGDALEGRVASHLESVAPLPRPAVHSTPSGESLEAPEAAAPPGMTCSVAVEEPGCKLRPFVSTVSSLLPAATEAHTFLCFYVFPVFEVITIL